MKKFIIISLLLLNLACQKTEEIKVEKPEPPSKVEPTVQPKVEAKSDKVDVPSLANKSANEFDKIYGKPKKINPATNPKEVPGEYRHYDIVGNEKGLSVRFYKDRAVRFNLFLNQPANSAKDALLKTFGVDLGNAKPIEIKDLSEKYKGKFGNLNFATIYAKKDAKTGKFVMVHAEIEQ